MHRFYTNPSEGAQHHRLARGGVLQRATTENRLQGRRGLGPCGTLSSSHSSNPHLLPQSSSGAHPRHPTGLFTNGLQELMEARLVQAHDP